MLTNAHASQLSPLHAAFIAARTAHADAVSAFYKALGVPYTQRHKHYAACEADPTVTAAWDAFLAADRAYCGAK